MTFADELARLMRSNEDASYTSGPETKWALRSYLHSRAPAIERLVRAVERLCNARIVALCLDREIIEIDAALRELNGEKP